MHGTNADTNGSALEKALSDLIRQALRSEIHEIVKYIREEDRLLSIDEVAERLSVSKDWIYRNGKQLGFTKKLGPKMVRYSEAGLQKWLKSKDR